MKAIKFISSNYCHHFVIFLGGLKSHHLDLCVMICLHKFSKKKMEGIL